MTCAIPPFLPVNTDLEDNIFYVRIIVEVFLAVEKKKLRIITKTSFLYFVMLNL